MHLINIEYKGLETMNKAKKEVKLYFMHSKKKSLFFRGWL